MGCTACVINQLNLTQSKTIKVHNSFIMGNKQAKTPSKDKSDAPPFPTIKSTHSLVAKHVTPEKWEKLGGIQTETCGFTLGKAIACAVEFDDQHCGIYAGD